MYVLCRCINFNALPCKYAKQPNELVFNLTFSNLHSFHFTTLGIRYRYRQQQNQKKNIKEIFRINAGNWPARNSTDWAYPMNNSDNGIYFRLKKNKNREYNGLQNKNQKKKLENNVLLHEIQMRRAISPFEFSRAKQRAKKKKKKCVCICKMYLCSFVHCSIQYRWNVLYYDSMSKFHHGNSLNKSDNRSQKKIRKKTHTQNAVNFKSRLVWSFT